MKKINIALLASALIILIVFVLSGCRARKVAKELTESTITSKQAGILRISETHIDTGTINTSKKLDKQVRITSDDSSTTKTTFKAVPGTTASVAADGTITGQAESITTERKFKSQTKKEIDSQLQEHAGELKGISDIKTVDSSYQKTDSAANRKETRTVDAKPHYGAWPWVAGIVVVLVVVIGLWWFFGRPKGK